MKVFATLTSLRPAHSALAILLGSMFLLLGCNSAAETAVHAASVRDANTKSVISPAFKQCLVSAGDDAAGIQCMQAKMQSVADALMLLDYLKQVRNAYLYKNQHNAAFELVAVKGDLNQLMALLTHGGDLKQREYVAQRMQNLAQGVESSKIWQKIAQTTTSYELAARADRLATLYRSQNK